MKLLDILWIIFIIVIQSIILDRLFNWNPPIEHDIFGGFTKIVLFAGFIALSLLFVYIVSHLMK